MGVYKRPTMRDYWSNDEKKGCIFVKKLMSRDRFEFILSKLHWENTSGLSANERKQRNRQDPFWQVNGFMDCLAFNFLYYFQPGQEFDIDEMCIWFKGRHKCRCYNASKPEKWHFKAFCLNCSKTGYLINFYLYRGKDEQRPRDISASAYPSYKLLQDVRWHNVGHILYKDNWFTSLVDARRCRERGIHSVGTVRKGVKNLPAEGIFPKKGQGVQRRGAMKCMHAHRGGEDYYLIAWQDNKPVHVLSTYKTYFSTVPRLSKSDNGVWERIQINRPTIIGHYNDGMGGTDQQDQCATYYRYEHRSTKWPHRIFTHFTMTACVNASILFKLHTNQPRATLRDFIDNLVEQLIDGNVQNAENASSDDEIERPLVKKIKYIPTWKHDFSRLEGKHDPMYCKDNRGFCRTGCGSKIKHKCVQCNAFLCINGEGVHNCWWRFHNMPDCRVLSDFQPYNQF